MTLHTVYMGDGRMARLREIEEDVIDIELSCKDYDYAECEDISTSNE